MNDLKTLDELKPELNLPTMNTGQRIKIGGAGLFKTDMEELIAFEDENGRIVIQSGQELAPYAYRGQAEQYRTCTPSIAREKFMEGRLIAACRNVAFQDILSEHPSVIKAQNTKFLGRELYVDLDSLAQHYGLATDMLDLTLNFDVASFFATSRLSNDGTSFVPIADTDVPGIIYRVAYGFIFERAPELMPTVGWQPLPRPEQQRALGLRMAVTDDLERLPHVEMIKFRQSRDVSVRIWESFSQGRDLFPEEPASDMATEAKELMGS